jgi:1-aminocyclopropane-1-carboxylate deaminase/D-cysteine desulfhydrase-like pyridoxal-dependent ACC family enzyme
VLRAIHDETIAFALARDASFPTLPFAEARVRIDGRFLGPGYGFPTRAGNDAIEHARTEGWDLDPVYTGKAFAAFLADAHQGGPALFWNTASSRPLPTADVPPPFDRHAR